MNVYDSYIENWNLLNPLNHVNGLTELDENSWIENNSYAMKMFIHSMRYNVERWNYNPNIIFLHPENLYHMYKSMGENIYYNHSNKKHIVYDMELSPSIKISDKLIIFTTKFEVENTSRPRYEFLAFGKMDYVVLNKLNKLRNFW